MMRDLLFLVRERGRGRDGEGERERREGRERGREIYIVNLLFLASSRRSPALFRKDPNHLLRLFKSLSKSDVERDVGLAIQECMGLVAPAYRGVGGQTALLLEAALLENVYNVRV